MTLRLAKLGDVCDINPRLGRNHGLSDDLAVSFVPMAAVSELSASIEAAQVRPFSDVKKGYTSFADGDVLFAKITPCMENGKAALARDLVGGIGFGSTEFHVLRAREGVLPEWIHFFVRQESFRAEAKRNFTGTAGQQRVPTTFLQAADIPVPRIEDQRRIVDLLTRAEGIVRLRREAQRKATELIPAIFIDMFGDPAVNPKGWPVASLGSIVDEFRYGTSTKSGASGHPVLRIPNVVRNSLDLEEMKFVALEDAEFKRLLLRDGDLLFVRSNGNPDYVGRCAAFVRANLDAAGLNGGACVYASYLIRARLNPAATHATYLQAMLSTGEGKRMLREKAKTSAGQYNINIDGLGSISVPLPPLELQRRFVRRVEQFRHVESSQQRATATAQATFNALLAQAFAPAMLPPATASAI